MKPAPPVLTPFVRSDVVGALLAETLGNPERETSLVELSRRTGALPAIVHREVSRLVDADVLHDRREGNLRLVRANQDHPLFAPMKQIIDATYGPQPVLTELLTDVNGVAEAFIYGSWAARRNGIPGPPPRDLDVLVVGEASYDDLDEVEREAARRLRTEVNIRRVSPVAWAARDTDRFLSTVASRPLVHLI